MVRKRGDHNEEEMKILYFLWYLGPSASLVLNPSLVGPDLHLAENFKPLIHFGARVEKQEGKGPLDLRANRPDLNSTTLINHVLMSLVPLNATIHDPPPFHLGLTFYDS